MNARDRIAKAMFARTVIPDDIDILWETLSERRRVGWLKNADAVRSVLPDLLTDPEIIEAVADRLDDEGTLLPETGTLRPQEELAAFAMDAAAKALTGGAP